MYQLHREKVIGATPLIGTRAKFQHLQFLFLVYINDSLGLSSDGKLQYNLLNLENTNNLQDMNVFPGHCLKIIVTDDLCSSCLVFSSAYGGGRDCTFW